MKKLYTSGQSHINCLYVAIVRFHIYRVDISVNGVTDCTKVLHTIQERINVHLKDLLCYSWLLAS